MNAIKLFYALMCCLVICTAAVADSDDNSLVLRIDPSEEFPRNSEGAFVTLADGSILYAYTQFYGGAADHSKARIVGIRSSDNGATWNDTPETIIENTGDYNVMSVSFLRLKSGRIALFYLLKNSMHDCKAVIRLSEDECKTWSDPIVITDPPGYFVLNNDRVIQLQSGRLVVPVAYHRPLWRKGKTDMDRRGITMWFLSDDEGASWYESSQWWAMPEPGMRSGFQEPGVVELAKGSLFSFARCDAGVQYAFRSDDGGTTFSAPYRSSLISPRSPASIKRIPGSDDLLALYNDHSGKFPFTPGRRTPLVAAISKDGGVTWPVRKLIESDPDGHYCYTAIHFAGDYALIAYCAGFLSRKDMHGLNPHRIRRMKLSWLYDEGK